MANSINIPRSHLIMGLCLPLAVLLGYFLAQPLESGSIAVVVLVLSLLSVPLFMKWHHPMLILSWNASANPLFLPGRPCLWMVMAFISLFFAVLSRSVNSNRRFIQVPSLTKPLLFLAAVVIATAMLTGGIGIRSLGSERYGGKGYFYLLAAIGGYFAFTSQRIPSNKAGLYVAMFFLAGLTSLIGDLALFGGGPFTFLLYVFAPDDGMEKIAGGGSVALGMVRLGALPAAAAALYGWLLAKYGFKGAFELGRPWRLGLIGLTVVGCLASGYRSSLILLGLTLMFLFCFEGLHRTRLLPAVAGFALLLGAVVFPQADKLPLMAQRALSFLPAVPVNPLAKESAQASTEWRVEMWKQVLPQVPRYFIKGKGYALDPNDLFMAQISAYRGFGIQASGAVVAGDYHNGPLSVLIPFGVFGLIGFIWLMVAGLRLLYFYHRFGPPEFQRINTFLLAAFLAKVCFFVFIFGSINSDLCTFLGILGVSVSLNGAPEAATEPELSPEPLTVFSERAY
jgi:hypothetical protein